jgi:hypothetical protein
LWSQMSKRFTAIGTLSLVLIAIADAWASSRPLCTRAVLV